MLNSRSFKILNYGINTSGATISGAQKSGYMFSPVVGDNKRLEVIDIEVSLDDANGSGALMTVEQWQSGGVRTKIDEINLPVNSSPYHLPIQTIGQENEPVPHWVFVEGSYILIRQNSANGVNVKLITLEK